MTELVGILNLTPDSFSGDGVLLPQAALSRIDIMAEEGAGIIDIGAESTRPYATALSAEEEWSRIRPLSEALGRRMQAMRFSIDTRHAEVARRAIAQGFSWINDVSGGADPAMLDLAQETGCTIVLMHSLGVPADHSNVFTHETDAVHEVLKWGKQRVAQWQARGLPASNLIFDPGIGFGKTPEQSLSLIKNIDKFNALGVPVMVGHSRKSFLTLFTSSASSERDPETLAISSYLVANRIDYLRVHNVKHHASMLRILAAL